MISSSAITPVCLLTRNRHQKKARLNLPGLVSWLAWPDFYILIILGPHGKLQWQLPSMTTLCGQRIHTSNPRASHSGSSRSRKRILWNIHVLTQLPPSNTGLSQMQKSAYQWISRNDSHGIQQLHVFTPKDEKNTSTDKNVLSKLPTTQSCSHWSSDATLRTKSYKCPCRLPRQ